MALQLPAAEDPCTAGDEDQNRRRLLESRRILATPDIEQLTWAVAVTHRRAAHISPLAGRFQKRRALPVCGPRLGEILGGDDTVQRLAQQARCERALGISLLGTDGGQPCPRQADADARYIASTTHAKGHKPREYLEMTPDERNRRRRGAQRDHVVTWLGSDRPPDVGPHCPHRCSVRRVGFDLAVVPNNPRSASRGTYFAVGLNSNEFQPRLNPHCGPFCIKSALRTKIAARRFRLSCT
jgi:hypothetical protein